MRYEIIDSFGPVVLAEKINKMLAKRWKPLGGLAAQHKIYRLLDFTRNPRDIRDPWYTGNFDETYRDICEECQAFLEYLNEIRD